MQKTTTGGVDCPWRDEATEESRDYSRWDKQKGGTIREGRRKRKREIRIQCQGGDEGYLLCTVHSLQETRTKT